jgi:hypothetical protein
MHRRFDLKITTEIDMDGPSEINMHDRFRKQALLLLMHWLLHCMHAIDGAASKYGAYFLCREIRPEIKCICDF